MVPTKELHRVATTAIIIKNGKYLIIQRSPKKKVFPGQWTVPGGGLKKNDYIKTPKTTAGQWYFAVEKALRREIKEETNLEVGRLNYLLDIAFIRPDKIPVIVLSYYSQYKSGRVKLDKDNIDYKWVSLKELKNYNLIEGLDKEIEMVDKILKNNKPRTNFLRELVRGKKLKRP